MAAIPVYKLFVMTLKTLSKPVAKRLVKSAQADGTMRKGLIAMAQATHNVSSRLQIRAAGFKTTKIKPLDEETAVAKGGDLFAEIFLYSFGATILLYEYNQGNQKSDAKEAKIKAEEAELRRTVENLGQRLDTIEDSLKRQEDAVTRLLNSRAAQQAVADGMACPMKKKGRK